MDVIKKEARGVPGDLDLGEVQEVGKNYVMTQKGLINREKYYIPKYMVEGFDGDTLFFNVTEAQFREFARDSPPTYEDYSKYKTTGIAADIETRIPVIEERLEVKKRVSADEATIVKEPVTETKTMEVPVTHEELRVERRPASSEASETDKIAQTRTEIKVPLTHEEVSVEKKPFVKEEVVVTKEPVTETQSVTETVTSERVDTENIEEKKLGKVRKETRAA
jgi:uncharacterized protein (TIGR02271 family)